MVGARHIHKTNNNFLPLRLLVNKTAMERKLTDREMHTVSNSRWTYCQIHALSSYSGVIPCRLMRSTEMTPSRCESWWRNPDFKRMTNGWVTKTFVPSAEHFKKGCEDIKEGAGSERSCYESAGQRTGVMSQHARLPANFSYGQAL